MRPLVKRLAMWSALGALLSASLLALDRAEVAARPADPASCLRAGQLLAVAGWISAWARFAPLMATRTRRWGLLTTLWTSFAAAAGPVVGALTLGLRESPAGAQSWTETVGLAFVDGALLSTLAACLYETTQRPRPLVVWFLALGWVGPALLGGVLEGAMRPGHAGVQPSPETALNELLLPLAAAFVSLLGALWAARPRFGAA